MKPRKGCSSSRKPASANHLLGTLSEGHKRHRHRREHQLSSHLEGLRPVDAAAHDGPPGAIHLEKKNMEPTRKPGSNFYWSPLTHVSGQDRASLIHAGISGVQPLCLPASKSPYPSPAASLTWRDQCSLQDQEIPCQ